jgi:hypothetical protein
MSAQLNLACGQVRSSRLAIVDIKIHAHHSPLQLNKLQLVEAVPWRYVPVLGFFCETSHLYHREFEAFKVRAVSLKLVCSCFICCFEQKTP